MKKKNLILFIIVIYILLFSEVNPFFRLNITIYKMLVGLVLALIFWTTKLLPYGISGLLIIFYLYCNLDLPFHEFILGFSSPTIFFFISVLLIGQVIEKQGLAEKIASRILTIFKSDLRKVALSTPWIVLISPLLIPSAVSRYMILKPVFERVLVYYNVQKNNNIYKFIMIFLGMFNHVVSGIVVSGSASVITAAEIMNNYSNITWLKWFIYMLPPMIILIFLCSLIIYFKYPFLKDKKIINKDKIIRLQIKGFTWQEIYILSIIGIMIILWILSSFFCINLFIPPIIGVLLLLFPGINILKITDLKKLNWDIIIFYASTISISKIMIKTKTNEWIANFLFPQILLQKGLTVQFIFFFVIILAFFRLIFPSNLTYIITTMPVVLSVALRKEINFISLGYITVFTSTVFLLPVHVIIVLIAVNEGYFNQEDIIFVGTALILSILVISFLAILIYWPLLDNIYPV